MASPDVSNEQLQRVHEALRIDVPLEKASPMMLSTLAVIARCWRGRIPSNLWTDTELQHLPSVRKQTSPQPRRRATPAKKAGSTLPTVDLKRCASGDID